MTDRQIAVKGLGIFVMLVATLAWGVAIPQASAAKPSCGASEYRQFDFWLGDWDVVDASGKSVGRNRVVAIQKGCALTESWEGNSGVTGSSINAYDMDRKVWHQTWIDSSGGILLLEGRYDNGKMVLAGEATDAAGKPARQKITWQKQPDGRVRQLWESSTDAGTTWSIAFEGYYSPRHGFFHAPLL